MKQIIIIMSVLSVLMAISAEKKTLHVGALLELSNHWYQKYVSFFPLILEHVFEEVENRTDILADYSLKLITKDTEGKSGLAARKMFELMTEGPPIVAVIGPTLSGELTVVGQITPAYDVVQFSYIAMTSSTVDRELFPTLFMVNQIMDDLNPLRIKMMQYFNWNRVGTIFFQEDISVSHMNMFHDLLKQYNMTLVTSAVVSDNNADIKVLIARLLQYDVRIIMGSFSGVKSPKIFCEAYKQGLYGSNYVWVLAGPIMPIHWITKTDFSSLDCTYEQVMMVADGHFTLNYVQINDHYEKTIANLTPVEIAEIMKNKVEETEYKLSSYYGWVYDTAWALAVGLNHSIRYLNASGLGKYTNNPYYLDAILMGMQEVDFTGISGPLSFDEGGRRVGVTYIEQNFISDNRREYVAVYNHMTNNLTWLVPVQSLWPGGEIPLDRFTYSSVMLAPNVPSLVLITIGNSACLVVAIGFLVFNIYYRNNCNIKLSSPMINNVTIAGSILMFVCVYFTTLDYGHFLSSGFSNSICMLRVWIMCLGFTCLFGALFSKTWRVHILFRDNQLKKKIIKDWHLYGIIVFLLLFDCIMLIPWSAIHSLYKERIVKNTKDWKNQNNIIAEVHTYCYHQYAGYWFVSIYIYKGLLLAFGTFLAWETRHVTVPALNDSKYIGFCIYNVVIVCVFGVPLTHVLPSEQTTLNFVLLSALVMFCTTMCLCILFIPKIKIRNKISGKFLVSSTFNRSNSSSASGSHQVPHGNTSPGNTLDLPKAVKNKNSDTVDNRSAEEIRKEIKRLGMQIEAETIAVERLKRLLLQSTGHINLYNARKDNSKLEVGQNERYLSDNQSTEKQTCETEDQCSA